MLKQGLLKVNEQPYSIVDSVRDSNFVALDHAYSKSEPDFKDLPKQENIRKAVKENVSLKIISPKANEKFTVNDEVIIKVTADPKKMNGRRVRFYYLDKKWKFIEQDETAPYEATWKSPPLGQWDIYVAVHEEDWKIVSKSRVNIVVQEENSKQ